MLENEVRDEKTLLIAIYNSAETLHACVSGSLQEYHQAFLQYKENLMHAGQIAVQENPGTLELPANFFTDVLKEDYKISVELSDSLYYGLPHNFIKNENAIRRLTDKKAFEPQNAETEQLKKYFSCMFVPPSPRAKGFDHLKRDIGRFAERIYAINPDDLDNPAYREKARNLQENDIPAMKASLHELESLLRQWKTRYGGKGAQVPASMQ